MSMNYFKQVITVTIWEFTRFFKPKNELLGIVVMIGTSVLFFLGTTFAFSGSNEPVEVHVVSGTDSTLTSVLQEKLEVVELPAYEKQAFIDGITADNDRVLVDVTSDGIVLYAYKRTSVLDPVQEQLNAYHKQQEMQRIGLSDEALEAVLAPASVTMAYTYIDNSGHQVVLSLFFAGLMVMAVFLSFAYQFTAITGEKQLKITEQIVSAISPQVWMDGKIYGITLTGMASMVTYSIIGIVGGVIFFQFTGLPASAILDYIHLPSILLYFPFAILGILIWNAVLAAIAAVITDPNNSGKGGLMMLPIVFVLISLFVLRDPDNTFSLFLSWFPLTSASAMPIRWATTEVGLLEILGSFVLLMVTFYFLRKLAAKIFRVTILINGKEPTFAEVYAMSKMA